MSNMTNTDVFVKSQQAYLRQIRETWSHALQQLPMLKELGKHHAEAIRRNQTEAGRARAEALQELLPQLATSKAALAYSESSGISVSAGYCSWTPCAGAGTRRLSARNWGRPSSRLTMTWSLTAAS
jgi:hypothetical protein